jgi:glycosyltransferase involved in cell wall biosynthesis
MNIGGPAYHVSLLSGRIDRGRYRTLLLTGSLGRGEGSFEQLADRYGAEREVVPGLRPELAPLSDLRALAHLIRTMRRVRPAVVHTHTAKAGTLGRLAAVLTPGVRPVVVHTFHGHVLSGYFGPIANAVFRWIERLLARRSDCLIGVSAATVEELVRLGVAPAAKFRVLPIGLDLDRLLAVKRDAHSPLRLQLGLSDDDVLVVFVGRLVPIKRLDVLIEALGMARRSGASLHLAVVGDGESRQSLERLTDARCLTGAVSFLGFRHDLPEIAAAADVAALSSDNEGTPVSLIEAAAAGLPAVATSVGGVGEIVTADTGVLVPAGDPAAFARALVDLAADAQTRARMGRRAREHVRLRYSAERLVEEVEELYEQLLSGSGRQ